MSDDVVRDLLAARAPRALSELKPYVPNPTPAPVRLDANEAPSLLPTLDESERRVLREALEAVEPARYPDVRARALREALSSKLGVEGDRLVLGVGSDEVIAILLQTLGRAIDGAPPRVLVPTPSFVMYRVSARIQGYEVVEVPLDADWDLDEALTIETIRTQRPAVVFLATPNNPTSGVYDRGRVERIVEAAAQVSPPSVVVVDEAYLPFRLALDADPWGGATGLDLLARASNVVVFRTFSKIGLAAIRVGWAVAHPLLAAEMDKVRLPYNLPTFSQAVAVAALGPLSPAIDRHVRAVAAERARVVAELRAFDRLRVGRTHANFAWVGVEGATGARIASELEAHGVVVRTFAAHPDRFRVSFGAREENDRFLGALAGALR